LSWARWSASLRAWIQIEARIFVVGRNHQRALEGPDGAAELALAEIGDAEVVVEIGRYDVLLVELLVGCGGAGVVAAQEGLVAALPRLVEKVGGRASGHDEDRGETPRKIAENAQRLIPLLPRSAAVFRTLR
jgi:hypothetical protein